MTSSVSTKTTPYDPQIPAGERALTRTEFARRVGVSPWTLQRYHREGWFRAFACNPNGGRSSSSIYLESQIAEFRRLPRKLEPSDFAHNALYSLEEAQGCFKAFDDGKNMRWCVIHLGVHPQVVEIIAGRYAALDQGIFVARPHMDQIDALGLDGPAKVKDGGDVLELLSRLKKRVDDLEETLADVRSPRCPTCARGEARFCAACVRTSIEAARVEGSKKTTGAEAEAAAPVVEPRGSAGVSPPAPVRSSRRAARARSAG